MSREHWMKRINQKYKEQNENRRLVKTRANDPRWPMLGDYYIVSTKTNAIVARHVNFADFAKKLAVSQRSKEVCR